MSGKKFDVTVIQKLSHLEALSHKDEKIARLEEENAALQDKNCEQKFYAMAIGVFIIDLVVVPLMAQSLGGFGVCVLLFLMELVFLAGAAHVLGVKWAKKFLLAVAHKLIEKWAPSLKSLFE